MPVVTPQARAQINANSENFQQPRKTITQPTGMMVANPTPKPAATVPIGQPGIVAEPTAPVVTLSSGLTTLARSQQKLQREIQAQRDKETAWEKERAGYIPKESIKAKAQQNAVEALQEAMGMSYEELTNAIVAQQNGADPVAALAAKIEKLEADKIKDTETQFDAIVKQYKSEAKKTVAGDTTKFAFLDANPDWIDGAVQYIVDEFQVDPENPVSLEDALAIAEENLRDEAKKQQAILSKLETPKTEDTVNPAAKTLPPPKTAAPRTLSQAVESSAPARTYNQFQHLSSKERLAAAIARATK